MAKEPPDRTISASLARVRAAWRFRGQERPEFAVEPGPGQASVWDYPRPPAIVPEPRQVQVHASDRILASSNRAVRVCETGSPPTVYVPRDDVDTARLELSATRSFCEWKGAASYLRLKDAGAHSSDVAWCYPQPFTGFEHYAGWLCFYPGRIACFLDSERVRPQPGDFYGGWITAELVGPFKGEPGTAHW
jgi:uncharacterized protein (DUF427 family)